MFFSSVIVVIITITGFPHIDCFIFAVMEDLPADLRSFLQKHPCFQLTDSKKVRIMRVNSHASCSDDHCEELKC